MIDFLLYYVLLSYFMMACFFLINFVVAENEKNRILLWIFSPITFFVVMWILIDIILKE